MRVRSPLFQRSWIGYNRELEKVRFIPDLNGLYECASGEDAMTFRTNSGTDHFCSNGIRDACTEHQFGRWRNLAKRGHLAPDFFWWCVYIEGGTDDEDRRGASCQMLDALDAGRNQDKK